jgi:hypothetical protein
MLDVPNNLILNRWSIKKLQSYFEDKKTGQLLYDCIKKCDCLIFFCSPDTFNKYNGYSKQDDCAAKDDSSGFFQYPSRKIFINCRLDIPFMIDTIFHEIGHSICFKNKCRCYSKENKENKEHREYHAKYYSLKMILKTGNNECIKTYINNLELVADGKYGLEQKYIIAAKTVMKTFLWRYVKIKLKIGKLWKHAKYQNAEMVSI